MNRSPYNAKSKKNKGLIIERFVVGPLEVNSYVVADPATKEAFLIDPGGSPDRIKGFIKKNGLGLKFIINTHGHGDHIAANGFFGVPIFIHKLDADFLHDTSRNLSADFGFSIVSPAAERLLEDGESLKLGALNIEIIHTPGHTPGSVSIKVGDAVFTGDALFCGSIGRTDFAYGDEGALLKAIKNRLLTLGDDVRIYPGHGESSTIGAEKRSNPFLM